VFIFEPLESFDFYVESDVDLLRVRRGGFDVKSNKYAPDVAAAPTVVG